MISRESDGKTLLEDEPDTVLAETDEPDVLSCDNYRGFWITWSNNSLAIGRGKCPDVE